MSCGHWELPRSDARGFVGTSEQCRQDVLNIVKLTLYERNSISFDIRFAIKTAFILSVSVENAETLFVENDVLCIFYRNGQDKHSLRNTNSF